MAPTDRPAYTRAEPREPAAASGERVNPGCRLGSSARWMAEDRVGVGGTRLALLAG
jgi:hypothetical protein